MAEKNTYTVLVEFTRPPQDEVVPVGSEIELTEEEAAELGGKVELVEEEEVE